MEYMLLATNLHFRSFIGFIIVMTIVGFCLMWVDRKRYKAHTARSEQMQQGRAKAAPAQGATADTEAEPATEGEENKKGKKKKQKEPQPYHYEKRISPTALFVIAGLFGGVGELFAMLIGKHLWYKWNFRVFIPLLAALNIALAILIGYFLLELGDDGILTTLPEQIVRLIG